jgi:hypothetical protein
MRSKSAAQIAADQAVFDEPGRVVKGVHAILKQITSTSSSPYGICLRHANLLFSPVQQPPPAQHSATQSHQTNPSSSASQR